MRWYRSFALSAVFVGQLLVGGAKTSFGQAQPSLQLGFDGRGLSAVTYAGNNVVQPKPMHVQMDLRHMFPPTPSTLPSGGPAVTFDPATHKAVQSYPWGTFECTYRADGDHLLMDVAVHNTSKESIFGLSADLLQLKLAGDVKVQDWWRGWPEPSQLNDAPEILDVATDDCSIAICNEEVTRPLYMNIRRDKGGIYTLVMRHDGPPRGQEIGGGDSREFHFSLRFG